MKTLALLTLLVSLPILAQPVTDAGTVSTDGGIAQADAPLALQVDAGFVAPSSGVYMNDPAYARLNNAVESYQVKIVALTSENQALKTNTDAAVAGSKLNIWWIVGAVLLGAGAGIGTYAGVSAARR